jgi:hypothetical protein
MWHVWERIEIRTGLVWRAEGKRLLGRSRVRWEVDIRVVLNMEEYGLGSSGCG